MLKNLNYLEGSYKTKTPLSFKVKYQPVGIVAA